MCSSDLTLDDFIEKMLAIDKEIEDDLEKLKTAPHNTAVSRVDEVKAARNPDLRWYSKEVESSK